MQPNKGNSLLYVKLLQIGFLLNWATIIVLIQSSDTKFPLNGVGMCFVNKNQINSIAM